MFEQVKVVDQIDQLTDEELVIFMRLATSTVHGDLMTGNNIYGYGLALSIKDRGRNPVAQYEHSGQFAQSAPGEAHFAAFLTGFTLFILSPITVPIINYSVGESKRELLEKSLHEALQTISFEMRNDRRLLAYGGASNEGAQQATARVSKPSALQSDVDRVTITRPSAKKNAYAVVVGIESYRDNLPKADFAANDAKLMGEYLTKVLGYPEENVVVRLNANATRNDLEKYVESWLPNHVEKDGSVFIYFSGHGAPNPKTGESYLVPYDGDPTFIDKTGYSLSRLYQHLADLPAKEVVVVLDSCFSGAGGRSVIAQGMRPIVTELKSPLLAKGKTIVLSASTGQQVSSTYGAKSHGLLTYFFLKGLQGEGDTNKDGFIELKELFDYLSPQVARVARREFNNEQTPQLLGNSELLTRGVRLVE